LKTPISTPTLAKEAYDTLRRLILSSELQSGERIIVRELCENFGLSPTPFKEALVALERDGLVTSRPRRGYIVANPDPTKIANVYEIRAVVEGLAARQATEHRTKELIHNLEKVQQRQREQWLAEDRVGSGDSDLAFHGLLWAASNNDVLQAIAERFSNQARLIMASVRQRYPRRHEEALDEHDDIIALIAAGHAREAEEAMRNHIIRAAMALRATSPGDASDVATDE